MFQVLFDPTMLQISENNRGDIARSGRIGFLHLHQDAIFWGRGLVLLFVTEIAPLIPGYWLTARAVRGE
jgi:hypothetical protein